jgi:hypothetical protein
VTVQSTNAVVSGNAVIGTFRSPDDPTTWIRPFASYFLSVIPSVFTNNVAAGSADIGVVLPPTNCSTSAAGLQALSGNEVHSALVGVFILSVPTSCAVVEGVTVWKCAHIGILTVDQVRTLILELSSCSSVHGQCGALVLWCSRH